jgi:tetratricopeptide (TPR) repeat protein
LEDQQSQETKAPTAENKRKQAQFWLEYGRQLSDSIRYTEALTAIERAVSLDESNVEACYALGTCLAMLARYDEALGAFERALKLDEQYVPAWDGKAWALGILGRRSEALTAVNKALELDPQYYDAQKRKQRLEKM